MSVKEPAPYDNLMNDHGEMVSVAARLPGTGDDETFKLVQVSKIIDDQRYQPYFKTLKLKFDSKEEVIDFQRRFELPLTATAKSVIYPFKPSLCGGSITALGYLTEVPTPAKKKRVASPSWKGMPEFVQPDKPVYYSIDVHFRTEKAFDTFAQKLDRAITLKTKSIFYTPHKRTKNRMMRWIEHGAKTSPRHPVYIVSKGRADTMYTSQALAEIDVPHFIAIEPQDEKDYEAALDRFEIRPHATLLILPFSNHGDGPGRARNYCWDHAVSINSEKHWVLDDNIKDFYRLNRNLRARVGSGAIFRAAEDFVARYENVPVSGFQYRSFIAPDSAYPPFVTNTRIYSTLLIDNKCPFRWRGRYNEDTDLCLRVLKDPSELCTIQFNAFLQDKAATQTVRGGNTEEFYQPEFRTEDDENYNPEGTINKSMMLYKSHPDVTRLSWRYRRWHHEVDYSGFQKNQLKLKSGTKIPEGIEEYGMEFIEDYCS